MRRSSATRSLVLILIVSGLFGLLLLLAIALFGDRCTPNRQLDAALKYVDMKQPSPLDLSIRIDESIIQDMTRDSKSLQGKPQKHSSRFKTDAASDLEQVLDQGQNLKEKPDLRKLTEEERILRICIYHYGREACLTDLAQTAH